MRDVAGDGVPQVDRAVAGDPDPDGVSISAAY